MLHSGRGCFENERYALCDLLSKKNINKASPEKFNGLGTLDLPE
jgi:hypothetical protein